MPVHNHNRRNKSLNFSCHQKMQPSVIALMSQEKENNPTTPKSVTHHKLYSILNPNQTKTTTPFTNRTGFVNREHIMTLVSTNRVQDRRSANSLNRRDQINMKIQQMLESSVIQRVESVMSTDGDRVKVSLNHIQKLNILEREKQELKNALKQKEDQIAQLEQSLEQMNASLQNYKSQIESYHNVESQVVELDRYCNQLLVQNQSLQSKIDKGGEVLFTQLVRDIYTKCKLLEQTVNQLSNLFSKCNKLTILLFNREEVPVEMFLQRVRKDLLGQESNLLSPVEPNLAIADYHSKINELVSFTTYASQQMLKKGQKTLNQVSSRYINNLTETYNSYQNF